MKIDFLKNISDINLKMLPPVMADEYNKFKFIFDIDLDGTHVPRVVINDFYAEINFVINSTELLKRIEFNKNISIAVKLYTEEAGYWDGYWDAFYEENILIGIEKEEDQIFEIFSRTYQMLNQILKPEITYLKKNIHAYNNLEFIKRHIYDYGFQVGTFIKAWTIILNNIPLFEEIFAKYYKRKVFDNPYPEIFNGTDDKAFKLFDDFAKEATDYYLDFSFIFQKMKSENLIKDNCRHLQFMDWLYEKKYISESNFSEFKDKESFTTKADRGMRATRYYKIKERYFLFDSDKSEKTPIDRK